MRHSKNLSAFIKKECANYISGGRENCLGCMPGTAQPFNDSGACLVINGKQCNYFERCVLPHPEYSCRQAGYDYEKIKEQYLPLARKRKRFDSAADYERWHTKGWGSVFEYDSPGPVEGNRCKDCKITIPPRKQYCDKCKIRRNRESKRRWKRGA